MILDGRFELVELLGSGGVAEVWRARDMTTDAPVAIKRLLPQLASDRQVRRRFLREADVVRRLDHPNIGRLLGTGEDGGRPFLAMELVDGEDLGRRLERRGRLSPQESFAIAHAVASALAHAHARGVVHRDVKPQNVLLAGADVKLVDFGLARVETLASMTGSSLLWGSPEYMAPELFTRGRADPRTDIFSLGVLMHEMLAGRLPWKDGRSPMRIAGGPEDLPTVALGQGSPLDLLVTAMLSPSPDDRPASAAAVIAVLEGRQPAAPLVRTAVCAGCGQSRPRDVPRCFACGREDAAFGHTSKGPWDVVINKVEEDATTMGAIHATLTELTGQTDLKLKFLLGRPELYSEQEKQQGIKLPAVMFAELDEPTARAIEARLANAGTKTLTERRTAISRKILMHALPGVMVGSFFPIVRVIEAISRGAAVRLSSVLPMIVLGGVTAIGGVIWAASKRRKQLPRFLLRHDRTAAPIADNLLTAAQGMSTELAAPEVRALFVEASRELYRLTRRAAELAQLRPQGSSEHALAQRVLQAAPGLGDRLAALARRLQTLDAALEGDDEADTARALAALERRLAAAGPGERPALEAARADLEAALDRRSAAEAERERLASDLCRTLALVRDLCRRAAAITTAGEREAAAIETAMRELETGSDPSP
jgi:hypothetical protein